MYLVAIMTDAVQDYTILDAVCELEHTGIGGTMKLSLVSTVPKGIRKGVEDDDVIIIPFEHSADELHGKFL
jgi:hypothetical protein